MFMRRPHRFNPNAYIAACFLVVANSLWAADGFKIEEAKWDREKSRLQVKGKGLLRQTITVLDNTSLVEIGSTRVSKEDWRVRVYDVTPVPCRVRAVQSDGQVTEKDVKEAPGNCNAGGGSEPPTTAAGDFTLLAFNDLGMHCADLDYQIFSILPPYNVVNAQVLQKGPKPRLMSPADGIEVTYQAVASNIFDSNTSSLLPIVTTSKTSTSQNSSFPEIIKSNFWEPSNGGIPSGEFGFLAYQPLYPPSVLGMFPFEPDLGLPAPNVEELYLGSGLLTAEQAAMPGKFDPYNANEPQPFHGYVNEFPFFIGDHNGDGVPDFPFGYVANNFKRYTAEGIPILPIDDQGRQNAYPLMRIEARDAAGRVLAAVDTVLPVASEADCQGCHLEQEVCTKLGVGIACGDIANSYDRGASYITADNMSDDPEDPHYVPGATNEQRVLNAAKINILRLHDAKESTNLDEGQRNIVCASCHYSPALDLAHLGPNDYNGKEQTQHVSMSRAMHSYHGNLPFDRANDPESMFADLFPTMPPPSAERAADVEEKLEATCYSCHPGKRTKCLRGAMSDGGVVCQDCHGQSTQVGNDFSEQFPLTAGKATPGKRVPWASEPTCQSCHVGDVLQVEALKASGALADTLINDSDKDGNADHLRLLLAYQTTEHKANLGDDQLELLDFPASRFASNLPLYRLSGGDDGSNKGHGGLACEGCHGSTHAIWPNGNFWANDNKTGKDLQGHVGSIIECSTCHEGDLGNTLQGPHGMHPVGRTSFAEDHEHLAEQERDACRACHGLNGEGTVLSRTATDRVLKSDEEGLGGSRDISLAKGTTVSCTLCHENKL